MEEGKNPRDIKFLLAEEIVERFHNKESAINATKDFIQRFQKNQIPDDIAREIEQIETGDVIAQLEHEVEGQLDKEIIESQQKSTAGQQKKVSHKRKEKKEVVKKEEPKEVKELKEKLETEIKEENVTEAKEETKEENVKD